MCGIGVDYMETINETITRVATSPGKRISTAEAVTILKNCGILNKNNQIKGVYKDIVFSNNGAVSEGE